METRIMKERRFSMVELLIVMAIIVVLAGILMTGAIYARRNARNKRITSQVKMIRLALTEYQSEYGIYPQQAVAGPLKRSVIESLVDQTGRRYLDLEEEAFSESSGKANMIDAFNNPFYYQCPGTMNKKTFDLWSMGPDGKHGMGGASPANAQTASEDTDDIANWLRK